MDVAVDRGPSPVGSQVLLYRGPVGPYRDAIHDGVKLVVAPTGTVRYTRRGRSFVARPGVLVVLHGGEAHSATPVGPGAGVWSVLTTDADGLMAVGRHAGFRAADPVIEDRALGQRFLTVFDRLLVHGGGTSVRSDLVQLLDDAVTIAGDRTGPGSLGPEMAQQAQAARRAYDHLRAHTGRNVPLDELARVVGVDKFRLVRYCTAAFGVSPHALHLRMRVDEALRLISGGAPLDQVALATGFADQAHFSRTFRRFTGMVPTAHQRAPSPAGDLSVFRCTAVPLLPSSPA